MTGFKPLLALANESARTVFFVLKVHTVLYDSSCLSLIARSLLCGPLILTQACLRKLVDEGANNEANFLTANFLTAQRLELIDDHLGIQPLAYCV